VYVVNGNADGRRSEVASGAACPLATCGKIQRLNPHLPSSPSSSPQTHPLQPMKCLRLRVNPRQKETRSKSSRLEVCKDVTVRTRVLSSSNYIVLFSKRVDHVSPSFYLSFFSLYCWWLIPACAVCALCRPIYFFCAEFC